VIKLITPGFSADASLHRNFESYEMITRYKQENEIIEPAYFPEEKYRCIADCFEECRNWWGGFNKKCLNSCMKYCRNENEFLV
jgi:hypothetical protein